MKSRWVVVTACVGLLALQEMAGSLSAAGPVPMAGKPTAVRTDRYGDRLPAGAVARLGTVRFRHGGSVGVLAFLPDGKKLVACADNVIYLWDVATGREVRRLLGHEYGILSVAISRDGRLLASAEMTGTIRLWDLATGKQVHQLTGHRVVIRCLAFSPSGKVLASVAQGDRSIRLWDVAAGNELAVLQGHRHWISAVAFSPDGRVLISAAIDETIRFWDVAAAKELPWLRRAKMPIRVDLFSPDRRTLVSTGDEEDQTIRLWDAVTGKEVRHWSAEDIGPVAFSPNGKLLAGVSCVEPIRLWDVATGKEVRHFGPRRGWVRSLTFSPDGTVLATGGDDAIIHLWDVATGKELRPTPGHQGAVWSLAFLPDGTGVLSGGRDGTVRIWDKATGRQLSLLYHVDPSRMRGAASYEDALQFPATVSPSGEFVVCEHTDHSVGLIEVATGRERQHLHTSSTTALSVAFSPDSSTLALSGEERIVTLWDVRTGKRIGRLTMPRGVGNMAFSPDGRTLACACGDRTVVLTDWTTGKERRRFTAEDYFPRGVTFSPDGKFVTWQSNDDTISLWDVASGRKSRTFGRGGGEGIAFSPDGQILAAGGRASGEIVLWETATGKRITSVRGHEGYHTALAFAPDGRALASGSSDTTALVWSLPEMIGGSARRRPLEGKQLTAAWSELAGADAALAQRAVWTLAAAPGLAVPFLREHLHATGKVDARTVAGLIRELNDRRFRVRENGTARLAELDEQARGALENALAGQLAPEARRRVEQLLERLDGPIAAPEILRSLRSVQVLEHISTPAARQELQRLAAGAPSARLTAEAKAALARLGKRRPN